MLSSLSPLNYRPPLMLHNLPPRRADYSHGEPHVCRGGLPLFINPFLVIFLLMMIISCLSLLEGGFVVFSLQLDPEGDFVEALGKQHTSEQAAKLINDHIGDWKGPLKR